MKSASVLLASLFVLQGLCILTAKTFTKREPFQSWKAPAETVNNYEIVSPVIRSRSGDFSVETHPKELEVIVDGKVLHLELNSWLLPAHFTSRYFDENNNEIIERGHVNCFYQGWVEGHPDWRVTMSTCHGLQGSFGNLSNREEYYHIEPLDPFPNSLEVPHVLYLATEYSVTRGSCGSKHHHDRGDDISFDISAPDKELARSRLRRQTSNGFLVVEWALVNDFRQFQRFEQNLTATVLRALEIANFVDSLYQTLNIRVVLVDVTTWTNGDQIDVVSNANSLLDNFELYKPQIRTAHDSAMLITNIDIDGSTVGIAYIGTMCNRFSSVGLSQDRRSGVDAVGSTAAHELGHIFNMDHDDEQQRSCVCNDPSGSCIMASISGFPSPTQWSDCSRSDLSTGFTELNLDRCLMNEPSQTVGDPVCGNGIRERDEICDCGTVEECRNPCCNATSCVLVDGADCGEGQCCENCQFKAYGTTCREASGECDITQYCSGEDAECPTDVHLQDGNSCNNNQSYCFSGFCRSHDEQCRYHWGSDSSMAVEECYDRYNIGSDRFGNCGYSSGIFVTCAPEDVLCGQLQCSSGMYQSRVNIGVRILTGSVRVNGVTEVCRSFSPINPPTDFMHPGLVEDGTRCGNERLCFMNECVEISSITSIQSCPVGSTGETCSGNGVCNNLNQCSCDVGFNGDSCQAVFTGPGSGQTSENNAGVIAGAVIGTLLGLALLAGLIVTIILLVVKMKPRKKYKYTPPTQSKAATTRSTSYKQAANGSTNSSPSVNVVRPGGFKTSYQTHTNPAPSAPPRNGPSYPPPKPPSRPLPPKAAPHAPAPQPPSKPSPPVKGYIPPQVRPVPVAPHKAPPPAAQRPQVAPRPPRQWPPPSASSIGQAKPAIPPKKPIVPPRY